MRVTCGQGCTWEQHGNASGHCSGCHRTFYGLAAFDAHRARGLDGRGLCLDPEKIPATKAGRAFHQDHEGQWHHGPPRTPEEYARTAEESAARMRSSHPRGGGTGARPTGGGDPAQTTNGVTK